MYKTAETVSSNSDNERYSTAMMDRLLLNNGYTLVESLMISNSEESRKRKLRSDHPTAIRME